MENTVRLNDDISVHDSERLNLSPKKEKAERILKVKIKGRARAEKEKKFVVGGWGEDIDK